MTAAEQMDRYLPLVACIARGVVRRMPASVRYDDAVSIGRVALSDAFVRAKHLRGGSFKHYVRLRVRGAIVDGLLKEQGAVRHSARGPSEIPFVYLEDLGGEGAAHAQPDDSRLVLEQLLRRLGPRELEILRLHYVEDLTFRAIAPRFAVSAERIKQIHNESLARLRAVAGAGLLHPSP